MVQIHPPQFFVYGGVAQVVEHAAHTRSVLGSSPRTAILFFKEVYNLSSLFDEIFRDKKVRNLILPYDKILIALSGGPDSVFLLYFLLYLREELHLELIAAHLHHMLRGEEAERDLLFCKKLTKDLNLPLIYDKIDVKSYASKNKLSIEEAARIKRYEFLIGTAKHCNIKKIALAHNLDDLTETFFMRLLRGTGISGLKGIPIARYEEGIQLIRPLLKISKATITNYLDNYNIPYIIDTSNFSEKYLRNYIRHTIVPHFLKINPKFQENILTLSFQIEELNSYLQEETEKKLKEILIYLSNDIIKVDLKKFISLPNFLKGFVLREIIVHLSGSIKGIYKPHIDGIYRMIESSGEKDYFLPHNIRVKKSYDYLFFYKGTYSLFSELPKFEYSLSLGKEVFLKDLGISFIVFLPKETKGKRDFDIIYELPYNIFKQGIVLRNRREGDKINNKKLKKLFIDKKIPYYLRDKIPLIAIGNKVLIIIGLLNYREKKKTDEYVNIGVKFERGGILWNELWKRFSFQKKRSRKE